MHKDAFALRFGNELQARHGRRAKANVAAATPAAATPAATSLLASRQVYV